MVDECASLPSFARREFAPNVSRGHSTLLLPENAHEAGPGFLSDDRIIVDLSRKDYDSFLRFVLERKGCKDVLNRPLSSEAARLEHV